MSKRIPKPVKSSAALIAAATAFTLGLAAASPAAAQGGLCGQRDRVVAQLKSVHGESRQSYGLQRDARVMETYANPETGSWTIIVSMPTGMACLVAAGEAFQAGAASTDLSSTDDPA